MKQVTSWGGKIFALFEQYGLGARAIAQGLNDAGIPGPSGGFWKANTIVGDRQVMTGIINNMLYTGVIVWNRQTWHVDVDTEKRRSTPLPREEWIYNDSPHLQIVTDDLCARVRARQGEFVARGPVRRRTRPLARLLLCGLCGSPMSVLGRDRYGCGFARNPGRGGPCRRHHPVRRGRGDGDALQGARPRSRAGLFRHPRRRRSRWTGAGKTCDRRHAG
ncbi:MAG: recombinase family protein [Amaricoccus sp.]